MVAVPFLMTDSFHADIGRLAEVRNSFNLGVLRIVAERILSTIATFAIKVPAHSQHALCCSETKNAV
jgi:hypothetical protein